MTAQTAAQRRAALVRRRKEAGLTEVRGIFLPPALHPVLKDKAARLLTAFLRTSKDYK